MVPLPETLSHLVVLELSRNGNVLVDEVVEEVVDDEETGVVKGERLKELSNVEEVFVADLHFLTEGASLEVLPRMKHFDFGDEFEVLLFNDQEVEGLVFVELVELEEFVRLRDEGE